MKKTPCICIRWHQVFYFYFSLVNIQKIRNTFLYLFFFVNIQEIQDIARQQVKNPYGQSSENNHFGDNYHRISIYFKHHPLYIGALGKVLPCLWELSLRWLHHRKGLVLSNLQIDNFSVPLHPCQLQHRACGTRSTESRLWKSTKSWSSF